MSKAESDAVRRRVLVLTEMLFKPDRKRLAGILRYAALHSDWEVSIYPDHPSNRKPIPAPGTFDGLISTGYFMQTIRGAGRLATIRPAVIFDPVNPADDRNASVFEEDNHAIGCYAAEFFLRKGFSDFAFVGTPRPRPWSDARCAGFVKRLSESGISASVYHGGGLERFLKSLPKPCGVLAAVDCCARDLLNACHSAGIAVPSQVSVLSVDNEDFLCETPSPTLSSIEVDIEEIGFRAAEVLDLMMSGRKYPARQTYGVKGIVERLSTSDLSGASRSVAIAQEFIRTNVITPITPQDVAVASGVSLRVLQRSFATVLNDSPANFIRTLRLKQVCTLLKTTTTPVDMIGNLCGFASPKHLKSVFRNVYGTTMSDYRRTSQGLSRPM